MPSKGDEDWSASVVGRPIEVHLVEPSGGGPFGPENITGRVRRVLRMKGPGGREWLLVVVGLDVPFKWVDRETRVVSIVSRNSFEDLSAMTTSVSFPVNVSAEPGWVLDCAPDDERLLHRAEGVEKERTIWLGFGGATLR